MATSQQLTDPSDDPVIRILLMGRKGSGKSSSGNTILGEKNFNVKKQHEAEVCEEVTRIAGKQVCVIDCSDLLDPDLGEEKCERLKEQLISKCSAGLSSVLITVPLEKPEKNEEEILDYIKTLFGPEVHKYMMILFTRGDELDDQDQTIDEYLQDHEDLQRLVTECGGKFLCFNNRSKSDHQKQELMQKIEEMMVENRGKFIMEQMKRSGSKEAIINFSGEGDEISHEHHIPERKDQVRLVLLGKTGSGKSATGNTIIGRKVFESCISSDSQTKQCQSEKTVWSGKEICVIDTPGLYDTELRQEEILTEIVKCITHASPGPHVFIIVIQVGRFTEEEKNTIEQLKEVFGEQLEKYSMILFTRKDQLIEEKKTIEKFLQNGDPHLKELVDSCGKRFFCVDNKSDSFQQFKDLLREIEKMIEENGGTHFTNDMFNETEKLIQEIQRKKLDEKVKQFKEEQKQVSQTEWEKIYWSLIEDSRNEAQQSFVERISEGYITVFAKIKGVIKVTAEEREGAIKEAESKGISRTEAARLAFRATRKLAKQKMCGVQ